MTVSYFEDNLFQPSTETVRLSLLGTVKAGEGGGGGVEGSPELLQISRPAIYRQADPFKRCFVAFNGGFYP